MSKMMRTAMEYRWFYRIMPKWYKFLYSFEIMRRNGNGCLHLGNGYCLNFETMTIDECT